MTRLFSLFAVLAFALALVMSAAGGAVARADMPAGAMDGAMDHGMGHGGSHHAPPSGPSQNDHHKAALAVASTCCPAAEAPAMHGVSVVLTASVASWHPHHGDAPPARDITPDTPPPKSVP